MAEVHSADRGRMRQKVLGLEIVPRGRLNRRLLPSRWEKTTAILHPVRLGSLAITGFRVTFDFAPEMMQLRKLTRRRFIANYRLFLVICRHLVL